MKRARKDADDASDLDASEDQRNQPAAETESVDKTFSTIKRALMAWNAHGS